MNDGPPRDEAGFPLGFLRRSVLDRGGMATLYSAVHEASGRAVALKVLREDLLKDETLCQRFVQEAKLTQEQDHPNIVEVVDSGRWGPFLFIAYELIEGGNLRAFVAQGRLRGLRAVVSCVDSVAAGLEAIHRVGIIHRDLKPENVLVREDGTPLLSDFGVAKDTSSLRIVSVTGVILGTPAYMSPEQLRGDPLDARTDVYSLGVVTYELLTGRLPWPSEDLSDLIRHHVHGKLAPPSQVNPAVPASLDAVVLGMLEVDRELRVPSVSRVREELRPWQAAFPAGDVVLHAEGGARRAPYEVTTAKRGVARPDTVPLARGMAGSLGALLGAWGLAAVGALALAAALAAIVLW